MGVRFKPGDDTRTDISQLKKVSFDKGQFLEDVLNDEYILLVGSEVVLRQCENTVPTGDINDYLLKTINQILKRHYSNYQEMMEDAAATGVDKVRNLLNANFFEYNINEDICPELRAFLETRAFNTVLTTTYDGYLETLMRSIWGERLRIVNIDDKASLDSFRRALLECRNGRRYREPTLFYLFGKAVADESRKYVRTDDDAIQIIEKWILMPKEDPILNYIRNRKLLALGCKFDNWYFRFFWYVLKREISRFREGQVAFMLDEGDKTDEQLKLFLERSRIYQHPDARAFMSEITQDMLSSQDYIIKNRAQGGVFISYCSKDIVQAKQLFFRLTKEGYTVWLDASNLRGGDDYNKEIDNAIGESTVFIPLLTPHIANDLKSGKTDNYYDKEWRLAAQYCRLNGLCILPLAIDGYDLRNDYHLQFEEIVRQSLSGIDLLQKDGMEKLIATLNQYK
ncbi:MAG: toll/interleukin-1 receptor domain-containing protein [Bacteroidales bacterium]|nr:toll/interleukin-1 receptor domain-containing protein [Bacteroidales bacterium]